jgi:hypothetical protein
MSRTAHFSIGLGILLLCVLWFLVSFVWFIGLCLSSDSVPGATIYDSSFIALYVVGGAGLLAGLWFAFKNFRRALQPPRLDLPSQAPTPMVAPEQPLDKRTPDEKLADLVKKTEA